MRDAGRETRDAERAGDAFVPAIDIDARGLYCPLPVLRLARALQGEPPGTTARLLATDPAAFEDVVTFCREQSCQLLESQEREGVYSFLVRKQR
jgi:tRNA 2-thiouridine synthesizing protein A